MARAAVKAKQAERAQVQAAKPAPRGRKRHASGGNPNQDLFFMRLRRRQRWVFLALAVVFAVSFAALGVGSGGGGALSDLYSGLFGGSSDAVSKAQAEIKTDPAKGYKDLATAYQAKGDIPDEVNALKAYLRIDKTNSTMWFELGTVQQQEGKTAGGQYEQLLQAAELASPSSVIQPSGALGQQLGTNPVDQYYSQQNSAVTAQLYQTFTGDLADSLTSFESAAKYASHGNLANDELAVANAAQYVGQKQVELTALQKYVALSPHTTSLAQIEKACKKLGGSCVPKSHKK